MLWMTPEDLKRKVIHRLHDSYGQEHFICYAPIWYLWPSIQEGININWQEAEEARTIPECPHCLFPLTATDCYTDEGEEYYICRFCEAYTIGTHIISPSEAITPTPEKPQEVVTLANPLTIKDKYRYLIG